MVGPPRDTQVQTDMCSIYDVPEMSQSRSGGSVVRIPPDLDVTLTPRVARLIDTTAFRRLTRISQLGLVSLVYPAANHTRQEHSLGVYSVAIAYLNRLAVDDRFLAIVSPRDAELFLVAALLHDLGHWPFCHPIEDISLENVSTHEQFANRFVLDHEIADLLRDDWAIEPVEVVQLLEGTHLKQSSRILHSMLSGPIDVDKVDYLMRDSLHAGVPYGRNFDQGRLVSSLCLNQAGDGLAITEKGKTAAESMVFARYVMFSEVYWHHTVRAATAMLQRAFFLLRESLDLDQLFQLPEQPFIEMLSQAGEGKPVHQLLQGIFGAQRQLYKRIAQYSCLENPGLYIELARRPYPWLVQCAEQLAHLLSEPRGEAVAEHEILIDAPPVALEVEFDLDVYLPRLQTYRRLGEISPVLRTLAQEQFDDYVKRVRIFAHPRLLARFDSVTNLSDLVAQAAQRADQG